MGIYLIDATCPHCKSVHKGVISSSPRIICVDCGKWIEEVTIK